MNPKIVAAAFGLAVSIGGKLYVNRVRSEEHTSELQSQR